MNHRSEIQNVVSGPAEAAFLRASECSIVRFWMILTYFKVGDVLVYLEQ